MQDAVVVSAKFSKQVYSTALIPFILSQQRAELAVFSTLNLRQ